MIFASLAGHRGIVHTEDTTAPLPILNRNHRRANLIRDDVVKHYGLDPSDIRYEGFWNGLYHFYTASGVAYA